VQSTEGNLIQLSTFGSDERASEAKVSQTIQFDALTGRAFARILVDTFGLAGSG
jgi:hypothetical protein